MQIKERVAFEKIEGESKRGKAKESQRTEQTADERQVLHENRGGLRMKCSRSLTVADVVGRGKVAETAERSRSRLMPAIVFVCVSLARKRERERVCESGKMLEFLWHD